MPNIVISEGLDQPWTLQNTEVKVTAQTDLDSVNLANQIIGQLAYTSSQLLTGLKTEAANLDKIVDAIDDITEEITLFDSRVAAWDSITSNATISDSVVGKLQVPLVKNDFVAINFVNGSTELKDATPALFSGLPESYQFSTIMPSLDRSKLNALIELTALKPKLDDANVAINPNQTGYLFLTPAVTSANSPGLGYWRMTNAIIEGGTDTTVPGSHDQLVVYRDGSGQPVSYKYFYMLRETVPDPSSFFGGTIDQWVLKSVTIPSSQLVTFSVPKDATELASWRTQLSNPQALIDASKVLMNTTGLPEGITPPVTTLGPSPEKYADRARYTLTAIGDMGEITQVVKIGAYPPLPLPESGFNNMSASDVGKFFKDLKTGRIWYVNTVPGNIQVTPWLASSVEPYISSMTDELKRTMRGEYAEKQILLTQRSTDQTIFVSSISNRYTSFSDMATNIHKMLMNMYNDLARNLRG